MAAPVSPARPPGLSVHISATVLGLSGELGGILAAGRLMVLPSLDATSFLCMVARVA